MANVHIPSPEEIRELVEKRKADPSASLSGVSTIRRYEHVPMSVQDVRTLLDRAVQENNCEPALKLLEMCTETHDVVGNDGRTYKAYTMPMDMRVNVLKFLTKFRLPELKSIEVKGQVDHKHEIVIVRYGEDGTIKREEKMAEVAVAPIGAKSEAIQDVEVVSG